MEKKSFILGFILAIVAFGLIALASAEDWNLGNPVVVEKQNVTGQQNLIFLPENAIVIIGAGGNVTSDVANLTYYAANQTLVVKLIKVQNISDSDNTAYYIDPTNTGTSGVFAGNVGIGTTAPMSKLEVGSSGATDAAQGKSTIFIASESVNGDALPATFLNSRQASTASTNETSAIYLSWRDSGAGVSRAVKILAGKENDYMSAANADSFLAFHTTLNNIMGEKVRIDSNGNVGIGTTSFPSGGGTPVLVMAQAGSAPTGLGSNTAGIYVLDVSGVAELFTIDEGGTSTQQTSHPSDFLNTLPNDENHTFPWVYTASNPYLGKKVIVDEEAAFRALEVLTGKQFVWIENISKTSWADTENWREQEENNRSRNSAIEAWLRNASDIPVDKNDAFEIITETITETTGNVTGFDTEYSFDFDGNVEENIIPKYETKTKIKTKKVKKADVTFDKKTGNFYRKPTKAEAEAEVGGNYSHYIKQAPPKWMADRGAQ